MDRASKRQYICDQSEYCEESWRLEETCAHSNSNEKPSANAGVKKTRKEVNNNNDGHFRRQTSEISHERTWTWLRKEKPENMERNYISPNKKQNVKKEIDKTTK